MSQTPSIWTIYLDSALLTKSPEIRKGPSIQGQVFCAHYSTCLDSLPVKEKMMEF